MKRSSLLLVACLFLTAACGGLGKLTNEQNSRGGDMSKTYRDVTNITSCNGTPTHTQIFGTWKKQFVGDQRDTIEMTYQISPTTTRITKSCGLNGYVVQTAIDVSSYVTGDHYVITQAADHTETAVVGGQKISCHVQSSQVSIPFRLVGNYLGFIGDSTIVFYTP